MMLHLVATHQGSKVIFFGDYGDKGNLFLIAGAALSIRAGTEIESQLRGSLQTIYSLNVFKILKTNSLVLEARMLQRFRLERIV